MNTKLDNVTTQYRKFNENQALTDGQLNEFIDYFEDQDRMSRTRLSGVGIVCGFQSSYLNTVLQPVDIQMNKPGSGDLELDTNLNTVVITQGAGVTTDGDLITLRRKGSTSSEATIGFEQNFYKYYRDYNDVAEYNHFRMGGVQSPFLELITQDEYNLLPPDNDFRLIKELRSVEGKVVILYLESYSNDETPCEDADCDNTGAEQVSNLKVLLADSEVVANLITKGDGKDTIYQAHTVYEELFDQLPKIEAKRVILDAKVTSATDVRSKFQDAGSAVADVTKGFDAIANTFKISVNFGGQNLLDKLNSLVNPRGGLRLEDYQYRYDLLKDLIDTYNEIKGLILHLNAECCPNISSFPKHLLLGQIGATYQLGGNPALRHGFYHSPVTTGDDENYERIVMLANRFVQKINGFQSYIGPVKITPSNQFVRLGHKAIPYYYNVDKSLLKQWNYEKTKTDSERYNLSYHTQNLAEDDFVQNPLNYNIDDNDFYRIEGHLGQPYKTALQNINDLKAKYGLAFDVIALVLDKGEKTDGETSTKRETVSIDDLRKQLISISSDISNQKSDSQSTLLNISKLDEKLRLLNKVEFAKEGSSEEVDVVKQDPKKDDVVSELLSEFLERKSGLEHLAGVERGGTFVLLYVSETDNQVLADFSLPYLCCSKKEPVSLILPSAKVCQEDEPIVMTVIPPNGEVKAFVDGVQIPAIVQSNGQSSFDPGLVASGYLEKTIAFTVNGDAVETQMVVYEEPNVIVTTGTPVNGESPTNPTATVVFTVSGNSNLSGLEYSWNFGDGKSEQINNPSVTNGVVKQTHVYNLTAGKEDTFTPVLTVSNNNGCSKQFILSPLKLTGQSTVQCLSSMEIIVQYNQSLGPCPGGHTCNSAKFNLMANGKINLGLVNLNNAGSTLQPGQNRPNNETSGPNRINSFLISAAQAQSIADTDPNGDGFISFSLVCADASCHTGVAWTTIKLGGNVIYNGCPTNNFLTINPCTGKIRS
ncbi:PKD domain-containing protein [Chryseobacterium sp. MYb264]|uniref:PKD domain-containing protein n=1 Tax=Chryseobacterium sp. MYb264 TaxID=2745153 RepID=UPI002E15D53A|nr:PKD domain-containing protein [Chryseobacterium sp. MYb264]